MRSMNAPDTANLALFCDFENVALGVRDARYAQFDISKVLERLLVKEHELGSKMKFEDIIAEVAGVYPKVMQDGDMDAGAWSCGMVVGLIHDIPTCQELIDTIMADAESIIRKRLAGFLDA